MENGGFRQKKISFTMIQNSVIRNRKLSLSAKGLYSLIQSYITMPDKVWLKQDFERMCESEGKKKFDGIWKELVEAGLLKVYITSTGKGTIREYDLLEEPDFETPYENWITKEKSDETAESPANTGFLQDTQNRHVGNRQVGSRYVGNRSVGNGEAGIDTLKEVNVFNNTKNSNTVLNNSLPRQILANSQNDDEDDEMDYPTAEALVKENIKFDKLIHIHQGNKPLIRYIFSEMVSMILETDAITKISCGEFEKTKDVRKNIMDIRYEDIEALLLKLPDKKENKVKNPKGYMRRCLFNIVNERGAICATEQIKNRGSNEGMVRCEYDFDELNKMIGI